MKKKIWIWIGSLLAAILVVGVIGTAVVHAQTPTNTLFHGRGPGGGRGLGQAELDAAAKALGMTTDELSTALQSGKTLEQIATDKKVDIQKVKDAINVAHRDEIRAQIKQAVTDGKMTQAKADWLLTGLDKGFLDEPGFGLGFGPHGHGFGDGPLAQPTQQSNP